MLFIFNMSCFAKDTQNYDVNNADFTDFGRYIRTLEVNEPAKDINSVQKENTIETEAENEIINDVASRYEKHAVVLDLSDNSDRALTDVNSGKVFNLKINETQYMIENSIRNENMIWDSSKLFSQAFMSDTRHMAPIPSVINSQSITAKVSPDLSASFGQTNLYDANGPSVLFVRANESTYNTGNVISYKGDVLNLSVGSFSSSYNHAASGGAILSSNSIKLPKHTGSFVIGGAYFGNEFQNDNKSTGGGFIEYSFKRLKLNAQLGQSKYTNSSDINTSLYFVPEFKVTDSFYVKTRFIRNVSENNMQDELVLTYKPIKNKNNLEFEINASNQYTQNSNIKQRIKLSTSFKI